MFHLHEPILTVDSLQELSESTAPHIRTGEEQKAVAVKPEILQSIKVLLENDPTVTLGTREAVLAACRRGDRNNHRKLCSAKEAAQILGCHPKTLYRYVRRGLLDPIHYSPRKVRFDKDQIEDFRANGLEVLSDDSSTDA